jgi:restriction endonuclease Mrr
MELRCYKGRCVRLRCSLFSSKKWDGVIRRPVIQKFAGALQGRRAKKEFLL